MLKVKVCGLTNIGDAEKALEYGADALGFNFYPPSARALTKKTAATVLQGLREPAFKVAVFVNESPDNVRATIRSEDGKHLYQAVQFHGEEDEDYCRGWDIKVIKAFRIRDREALRRMNGFPADFYLLDSWSSGYGGSGTSFPWDWLAEVDTAKIILSGGLTVENVADAVRRIKPYGIDVCSGVEARPGIKDHAKLKEFILRAKGS